MNHYQDNATRHELLETIARLEGQIEQLTQAVTVDLDGPYQEADDSDPASRLATRYQQLIASCPDILWRVDLDGMPEAFWAIRRGEYSLEEALLSAEPKIRMRVNYSSPATWQVYGMSPEDKCAQPIADGMTAESLRRSYQSLYRRLEQELAGHQTGPQTFELDEYRLDGTIIHTEVKCHFARGIDGIPIAIEGTTRDITSRKRTESRLAAQLRFQQIISQISTDFINVAVDQVDETFDRALATVAEFLGAERALLLLLAEDDQFYYCEYEWVADPRRSIRQRLQRVELHEFGSMGALLSQRQAVFIPDVERLPETQIAEQRFFERVQTKAAIRLPMSIGGKTMGLVSFHFLSNEQQFDKELEGQLKLVSHLFASAVRRQRIEESLRDSNSQLEIALRELHETQEQVIQQERLRALGQMASGVAHDLNNALAPVLAHGEVLFRSPDLTPEVHQGIAWILTGAHDAAEIVRRLQSFYRPHSYELTKELVLLPNLLRELGPLTQPKWRDEACNTGRTIDFQMDIQDDAPVHGVASELRQVFINLIFNAVDAMPIGGSIRLRSRRDGDTVTVELEDTGYGMSQTELKRCFEPFFTTKPTGSGLGLSVCHGIIKSHGGRIEAESEPSRGTRFRITLPIASASCASAEPGHDDEELPFLQILYIDDDERVRPSMAALLGSLGQRVDLAESGPCGLDLFQKRKYDLVITDLGMPGMDGRRVTHAIKQLKPETPVFLVSGWSELTALEDCDDSERPDTVLTKP
ncbi:MAG: response regulator, partial [Planctomycetales bacterium]|nr:response regulator [Planctomycetales bacterium]